MSVYWKKSKEMPHPGDILKKARKHSFYPGIRRPLASYCDFPGTQITKKVRVKSQ